MQSFSFQSIFKVIGDRKGKDTALALTDKMSVLDEIREVVQVPIKLIHVIRNPFDNIATMMLHAVESRDAVRGGGLKVRASLLNFNTTKPGGGDSYIKRSNKISTTRLVIFVLSHAYALSLARSLDLG